MYPGNIMEYAGQYDQEEFNKVIRGHLLSSTTSSFPYL